MPAGGALSALAGGAARRRDRSGAAARRVPGAAAAPPGPDPASTRATLTGAPSRSFSWPAVTTTSSCRHPVEDLDPGVAALADLDLGAHRLVVDDAVDELLVALRHQRLLGQHQRVLARRA